ncbi:MAG: alpha-ketoacid dehydrogenase subunit beta [Armatimonadetes bacterium]|nr:alpha-ketoacid dehydrogenase subunit beta [Armatimonadota bacterium]
MSTRISYMNAIRDGIAEEMRLDPTVITLGEGIGERGGSYAHTKNLWQEFGSSRVIDVPICENGFTGMAIGAAASGLKPIVDLMFADMLYEAMGTLCHQAGKLHHVSNGGVQVPMVVRAQMGGRTSGAHHSACPYSLFMHCPGFKVVAPSNPADAKGLIKASIRDPNPVIFFEHKFLYPKKDEVPDSEYITPIGEAKVVREGSDVTLVAISSMVGKALNVAEGPEMDVDVELIDPRTLYPLDIDTILRSVAKTGRLTIVEEAHLTCGAGAEIAALVCQHAFDYLRAPIIRVASLDTPNPYAPGLEAAMIPSEERILTSVRRLMEAQRSADVRALV